METTKSRTSLRMNRKLQRMADLGIVVEFHLLDSQGEILESGKSKVQEYLEEEKELLILKSQWTQMKSEEDYKQIYIELQNVAAQNEILLPENKLFSLTAL